LHGLRIATMGGVGGGGAVSAWLAWVGAFGAVGWCWVVGVWGLEVAGGVGVIGRGGALLLFCGGLVRGGLGGTLGERGLVAVLR
jgi:hypothetical protein